MKLNRETAELINDVLWALCVFEIVNQKNYPSGYAYSYEDISRIFKNELYNFNYHKSKSDVFATQLETAFYLTNIYKESILPQPYESVINGVRLTTHTMPFLRNNGFVSIYDNEQKEENIKDSIIVTNKAVKDNFDSQKIVSRNTLIIAAVTALASLMSLGWTMYREWQQSKKPISESDTLLQKQVQVLDSLLQSHQKTASSIDSLAYYLKTSGSGLKVKE